VKIIICASMIHYGGLFLSFIPFYDRLLQHIKSYWIAWGFLYTRRWKKQAFHAGMTAAQKNERPRIKLNCNLIITPKFLLLHRRNAGTLDQHLTKKGDRELGNYLMAST
jgi:hypothetical protein